MKLRFENIPENPVNLMRRIGYSFQRHSGNEMSFIRPLARAGYPRFHMYIKTEGTTLLMSFHLDQKKETYGEDTRHHGEYDDTGALGAEAERITKLISDGKPAQTFEP